MNHECEHMKKIVIFPNATVVGVAGEKAAMRICEEQADRSCACGDRSCACADDAAKSAQDAKDIASNLAVRCPYPDPDTKTWWQWDVTQNAYVDTGIPTTGPAGSSSGRNYLINPEFSIWQRAFSQQQGSEGIYAGPDRWFFESTGTPLTWTAQSRDPYQINAPVPPIPSWTAQSRVPFRGLNLHFEMNGTGSLSIHQKIEGLYQFSGQTVTLSFEVMSSSQFSVAASLRMNFGYPAQGAGGIGIIACPGVLVSNPPAGRLSFTFKIPDITGHAGQNMGADNLECVIWFCGDPTSDSETAGLSLSGNPMAINAVLSQVKLEMGSTPTLFEPRLPQDEMSLCRRFYERGSFFSTDNMAAIGTIARQIQFCSQKRAVPVISLINGSSGDPLIQLKLSGNPTVDTFGAWIHCDSNPQGFFFPENGWSFDWAADAEL